MHVIIVAEYNSSIFLDIYMFIAMKHIDDLEMLRSCCAITCVSKLSSWLIQSVTTEFITDYIVIAHLQATDKYTFNLKCIFLHENEQCCKNIII